MKVTIFMFFLIQASLSYGWECLGQNKGLDTKFEDHIELASEIYLGRPTNAYLIPDIHKIVFEVEVSDVFKGTYKSNVTLFTSDNIMIQK